MEDGIINKKHSKNSKFLILHFGILKTSHEIKLMLKNHFTYQVQ